MDEFVRQTTTPAFWFGVVFVGIVINVASRYIGDAFDRGLSHISGLWRRRSEKARAEYTKRLKSHLEDPNGEAILRETEVRQLLYSIASILLSVGMLVAFVGIEVALVREPSQSHSVFEMIAGGGRAFGVITLFIGVRFIARAVATRDLLFRIRRMSRKKDTQ